MIPLLLHVPTIVMTALYKDVISKKQMFENQHIKMERVMYKPKRFMYCLLLPDMF
jgi:hypothetical protein